jgi:protein TonB
MFEQSLVESSRETTKRKRWTSAASFSIQLLAIAAGLAFPLLHTDALPFDDRLACPRPPVYNPPHVQIVETARASRALHSDHRIITTDFAPQYIPKHIDMSADPELPSAITDDQAIMGAIPGIEGRQNPVIASMLRSAGSNPIHHVTAPVVRASHAEEGLLIRQIKPAYPPLAKQTRIQGTVVLQAIIARDGTIQQLRVASGHPLLTRAAVEAVQQWRYRPYLLNGEPGEVETQITVNFTLNGN